MSTGNAPIGDAIFNVYLANRVLASAGGLDAWGHVSARHPEIHDAFLMARSRSPMLVEESDIVVHDLAGNAVGDEARSLYPQRAWEYWAHLAGIPYRRGAYTPSSARTTR